MSLTSIDLAFGKEVSNIFCILRSLKVKEDVELEKKLTRADEFL